MAKIKKIQESGETIYPATIFQAVKDPKSGQTLDKSFEGEHKKLTAGFAYEILGDGQATSEKFSFRPTGGPNRNVRDGSARIEVLKGNSVVWNQLGIFQDSFTTSQGVTFTKVGNSELRTSGTIQTAFSSNNVPLTKTLSFQRDGRKYLISMLAPSGVAYGISGYSITNTGPFIWSASDGSTWKGNIVIKAEVGQTIDYTFKNLQIIDLTKMFGADIANTITKPEQFYELLPEGVDINAYNDGEIVDANYKAIKTTGFNQWDEQWRTGEYDSTTGEYIFNRSSMANTNLIRVVSGCNYYVKLPAGTAMVVFMYDYNMTYIGTTTIFSTLSIPANVSYINFRIQSSYGLTYKNDICINIAWDEYSALNGTYKPNKPFERDLSWIAKYFPNGMRSAGNVADEIRFNSTTQQWEAVQRVDVRAYQSGDEADTAVTTDGKNTNYALATPDVQTITEDVNLAYDVADYGTEQLIVADGTQSAPLSAKVVYEPNVLASIKQVAEMLTRLDALETAVATMQASAIATTNEE